MDEIIRVSDIDLKKDLQIYLGFNDIRKEPNRLDNLIIGMYMYQKTGFLNAEVLDGIYNDGKKKTNLSNEYLKCVENFYNKKENKNKDFEFLTKKIVCNFLNVFGDEKIQDITKQIDELNKQIDDLSKQRDSILEKNNKLFLKELEEDYKKSNSKNLGKER